MPNKNTHDGNDIVGQYVSDLMVYPPDQLDADQLGVKAMRGDGNPVLHHDESLFDAAAGLVDPVTGLTLRDPSAEAQHFAGEDMRIVSDGSALGALSLGQTDADKWMSEHGYTW